MPTYTMDYGSGANGAWGQGLSALAQAMTPDYKGQAEAGLRAAQADQAYSGSAENLAQARSADALAGKYSAETQALGDTRAFVSQLAETLASPTATAREKQEAMVTLGVLGEKVSGADAGKWSLAYQPFAENGDDPASYTPFQLGAGMGAGDTVGGFNADQLRKEHEAQATVGNAWNMNEADNAAAAERAAADNAAALERQQWTTQNAPHSLGENSTIIVTPGDPRWTPENQGVITGQRSVGKDETIFPAGGGDPLTGVLSPAAAPTTTKVNIGNEEVTLAYDPTNPEAYQPPHKMAGYVELARAPRTGTAGEIVRGPLDKALEDVAIEQVTAVAGGRPRAQDMADKAEMALSMLDRTLPAGGTGPIQNDLMLVRQYATSLGLGDEAQTATLESLGAMLGNYAMARIQETKGAVSEKEMEYFRQISPGLGKSTQGNRVLLTIQQKIAERSLRAANMVDNWREAGMDAFQMQRELDNFFADNPILTEEDTQKLGLPPLTTPTEDPSNDVPADFDFGRY